METVAEVKEVVRNESQSRAINAMEEAMLFVRNLPAWVEVATIELMHFHQEEPEIKLQLHEESFARLLAGKEVRRFCNGTMAIVSIDGIQLYSSLASESSPPDGPYVMPATYDPIQSPAVAAMHAEMDREEEGGE